LRFPFAYHNCECHHVLCFYNSCDSWSSPQCHECTCAVCSQSCTCSARQPLAPSKHYLHLWRHASTMTAHTIFFFALKLNCSSKTPYYSCLRWDCGSRACTEYCHTPKIPYGLAHCPSCGMSACQCQMSSSLLCWWLASLDLRCSS
jgi:hypothetical protein